MPGTVPMRKLQGVQLVSLVTQPFKFRPGIIKVAQAFTVARFSTFLREQSKETVLS